MINLMFAFKCLLLNIEYILMYVPKGSRLQTWGPRYIAPGWTRQKTPPPTGFLLLRRLPSDSPDTVDAFTGSYKAMHICPRDRCMATGTTSDIIMCCMIRTTSDELARASSHPCWGGIEYLHRDPASRMRRRKGSLKSETVKYGHEC
jgi:hypothetical protein